MCLGLHVHVMTVGQQLRQGHGLLSAYCVAWTLSASRKVEQATVGSSTSNQNLPEALWKL